jgi:GMP synthase (glutamine-hydrolysing)
MTEKVVIFDFGSQYTQLIARRLRELHIYCEIYPFNKDISEIDHVSAVILSGSPFSVLQENSLNKNLNSIIGKFPLLAICYGAQLIARDYGGKVHKSDKREYGKAKLHITNQQCPLFNHIMDGSQVWMSHSDSVAGLDHRFEIIAETDDIPVAAYRSVPGAFDKDVYALQFHPEVTHSLDGKKIMENFVFEICQLKGEWTPEAYIEETVQDLRNKIADDHVLMGLSGGVDSSVAATLIHKAIGDRLTCVFIDNGLLRKNEFEYVLDSYKDQGLNVIGVDATNQFLEPLSATSDPEEKRKIIGRVFIEVFEEQASRLPNVKFLGQGTIYPDVIESVSVHGPSVTIKSHHNVGGLPEKLRLKIIEPLRMLFKDEVRIVGKALGLPDFLIGRHPFPGPGLAIRVLGNVTLEKIRLCQEADFIFINKLKEYGLYDEVWQAGVMLLPVKSVGVMGDERTYEYTVALRSVNSVDGMTAEWSRLPHEFLAHVSSEIINKVNGINRVVYDISTKPPATIEWE